LQEPSVIKMRVEVFVGVQGQQPTAADRVGDQVRKSRVAPDTASGAVVTIGLVQDAVLGDFVRVTCKDRFFSPVQNAALKPPLTLCAIMNASCPSRRCHVR
jgi:hypothetical protein